MQYLRAELQRQVYKVRRKRTVTTKLDAPYTLLSIRGRASRISVSSEVKGEFLQAHNVDLKTLMPPEPSTATAITKSVPALVQKLLISNDQSQKARRQTIGDSLQGDPVLAKLHQRTEKRLGKMTRKEQRAKILAPSKVQSEAAIQMDNRVEAQAYLIARQHPKMTKDVTEGQSPFLIKRYPSINPRDTYETHEAAPEKDDVKDEFKYESRSPPDDLEYEDEPDSISVIREESEGKDPGSAHVGKEGNTFMIRKHATMNPFERLQAIQKVGEIRYQEQARRGLHGQYHLVLDNQLEQVRKS